LSRQSLLAGAKATAILSEYNDGAIAAISFRIATEFGVLTFRLPANLEGAYAILMRSKQIPRSLRNHAQARRVAWRSVLHWLDSQLALIQAGLASLDQLFLPFAQDSAGVNPIRADTRGKVLRAAFRAGQGELTELIGAARIPSLGELLLNLFPAGHPGLVPCISWNSSTYQIPLASASPLRIESDLYDPHTSRANRRA
jgi:hypothetical protein